MNKWLALLIALALGACSKHDHDAKGGHPPAGEHAHEAATVAVTHYTDVTELFVEFPPLVRGQEAAFAAHLTRLEDWSALVQGQVTVQLAGGGQPDEVAHAK